MDRRYSNIYRTIGTLAALGFLLILVIVTTGSSEAFDERLALWACKIRSAGLNTLMEGITYLGNWSSIVVICLLLLAFEATRHTGVCASLATAFTWLLNKGIQHIIMRERPDIIMRLIDQGGPSFPSAHASASMAMFISIAICLFAVRRRKKAMGFPLQSQDNIIPYLCIVAPILIAFSRVYLGVHWMTDVIGGALEGLAIAMLASPRLFLLAAKIVDWIDLMLKKGSKETVEE